MIKNEWADIINRVISNPDNSYSKDLLIQLLQEQAWAKHELYKKGYGLTGGWIETAKEIPTHSPSLLEAVSKLRKSTLNLMCIVLESLLDLVRRNQ